ncbi:MAG: hypothetical protein QG565_1304 [Campylobacterota bacterium]|nr:hypothetical protein [Campylobacterota bacterium]MDQ1252764.1 hypothetical protein [Euryarchaeota archaeon]
MTKKIILGLVAATSMAFGSASIIDGSSTNITFNSKPEGAKVQVDGIVMCVTPCTVKLQNQKRQQMITFDKEGYERMSVPLTTNYNGVAILNVFWDLSTTDLLTGAAWKYDPTSFFMELTPKSE